MKLRLALRRRRCEGLPSQRRSRRNAVSKGTSRSQISSSCIAFAVEPKLRTTHRFFLSGDILLPKNTKSRPLLRYLRAGEQNEEARVAWRKQATRLPSSDLVFGDETGSHIARRWPFTRISSAWTCSRLRVACITVATCAFWQCCPHQITESCPGAA